MEPVIALIVLVILGIPIALTVWLVVRAVTARQRIEELSRRVDDLQIQVIRLTNQKPPAASKTAAEKVVQHFETVALPPVVSEEIKKPAPAAEFPVQNIPSAPGFKSEIPLAAKAETTPPPLPEKPAFIPPAPPSLPLRPPKPVAPKINWEQFMGVKGFAWVGGFALFLGVTFFVKYAFDNNLISPQVQVAIGFLAGIGLLVGGTLLHSRQQYVIGAQALCATGVVILYAVTFASRVHYHFLEWPGARWDALPAFGLMALITATGFFLSVRLNALVVAILGMLGGFLTPILINTEQDNPLGLFGYIAILDAGLIFVALNKRWHFLTALAALGTVFMQVGWADKFFESGKIF